MGICTNLFGITTKTFLKRCVGLSRTPQGYKDYKKITTDFLKKANETSCTRIKAETTAEWIAEKHGFTTETLETLQTTEFIKAFHKLLASKGYKTPGGILLTEQGVPSGSGILGCNIKDWIWYNPCSMKILDLRIPIHESGHMMWGNHSLQNFLDGYRYDIGTKLQKIPFLGKFVKGRMVSHLSTKNQKILKADYKRAWEEGYFKHNPIQQNTKILKKLGKKGINKLNKDFRRHPEEYYLPNSLLMHHEFIADVFNLKARGFKFSPEIEAIYKKYRGPEIKEIITEEDMQMLETLRKTISKKTLSDYGYAMTA